MWTLKIILSNSTPSGLSDFQWADDSLRRLDGPHMVPDDTPFLRRSIVHVAL
jgi:hypothetical protein